MKLSDYAFNSFSILARISSSLIPDYNPDIEDELLKPLGDITQENMLVLVTITVPKEIEKMSVNLKGPIIINSESRKAGQLIIDDDKYQVKFPIYEILKAAKEKAGE